VALRIKGIFGLFAIIAVHPPRLPSADRELGLPTRIR
jgi:hypothetical protein